MKKVICIITMTIIASQTLIGCIDIGDPRPAQNTISVISLKETLPLLEVEAKIWQNDAYLAWVDIGIRLDYPENARVLTAQFYSPSKEFESLGVEMSIDGVVSLDPVEHSVPVYQQSPITVNDWGIDSQEALDLMLDQDGLRFIQSKDAEQCSFLILERLRYKPEQPLAWRLTLMECFGDYVDHTLIDPITGEILEE